MENFMCKKCAAEKKGFTLVELVVVIAIMALLAAIAVPSVIAIINSASRSQVDTEAASIDQACKDYYMGVKSGAINKENFKAEQSGDEIPNRFVSISKKDSCARNCTVAGALEYSGMTEVLNRLDVFGYDAQGNIKPLGDPPSADLTPLALDGSDTFATLNYVN